MSDEDIKRAIREFLVGNWHTFQNSAIEQGMDEEEVKSEQFDEKVDDILLS